jgi:iron complex outermembrane receptor protein
MTEIAGARLQALCTPNDDVTLRMIADYSEIDEICCGAPVQLNNDKLNAAGALGSYLFLGSPLFGATILRGENFFDREVALSLLPVSTMEDTGISAELNWDLDDNFTFVSISAYRAFDSYDEIDTDFIDADLFFTVNDAEQN